ncbi:putative disease resistance protein At1g50180 [Miscanthus floridulus]|uniref:putative disease resistance protein At1g50180 n=1 Tax=Miscanthus floridulus TaxID=154761 RepID=UPI0034591FCF
MDVATGALGNVISKLSQLLHDEYKMQKGVRHQVESLLDELKSIYFPLRDVAEVPPDMLNEQVKNWAREIREASYNIEDRIDTFLVSVDGCREPIEETCCWWLKRAKKKMGDLPTKRRAAMEDIMKQLQEVSERCARFTAEDFVFRPLTSTSITVDPRLPALYRNERELVGIEEAREELVRLLTQGDAEDDKKRELKASSAVRLQRLCFSVTAATFEESFDGHPP